MMTLALLEPSLVFSNVPWYYQGILNMHYFVFTVPWCIFVGVACMYTNTDKCMYLKTRPHVHTADLRSLGMHAALFSLPLYCVYTLPPDLTDPLIIPSGPCRVVNGVERSTLVRMGKERQPWMLSRCEKRQ